MMSSNETFWDKRSFAVVGHAAKRSFPRLTYGGLKRRGKTVFAVDPSLQQVDGDQAYPSFEELPEAVEAAVLEVPKEETRDWVRRAADAGIKDVWIHQQRDTPEALALAEQRGIDVRSGACAVMYLTRGFTYHTIHKWIVQLAGKY